jgi:hypothetical protein
MEKFKKLSRAEMKRILGGGTCAAYLPSGSNFPTTTFDPGVSAVAINNSYTFIGMSSDAAQKLVDGVSGAHWCCDHCSTSPWYKAATSFTS